MCLQARFHKGCMLLWADFRLLKGCFLGQPAHIVNFLWTKPYTFHLLENSYTVTVARMLHWKWRETKQQPSRARSDHQISCCLASIYFLCDILATVTVLWVKVTGFIFLVSLSSHQMHRTAPWQHHNCGSGRRAVVIPRSKGCWQLSRLHRTQSRIAKDLFDDKRDADIRQQTGKAVHHKEGENPSTRGM